MLAEPDLGRTIVLVCLGSGHSSVLGRWEQDHRENLKMTGSGRVQVELGYT